MMGANPRFCDHDPRKYKVMGPLYWCPQCQEHYAEGENTIIEPAVKSTTIVKQKVDLDEISVKGPVNPKEVPTIPEDQRQPVPDGCPRECVACQYRKGKKTNPGKWCVKYKTHLWKARKEDCIYEL